MRIFMQGLVGCSMREGVCARAYIQRRPLTASRRSMDTSIATRSLSARLRRGRSRTRHRRYRCSRRSCSRRLRDDGAAPAGEDVGPLHSCASLLKQRSISSREPPQAGAPVTLPHYIYIPVGSLVERFHATSPLLTGHERITDVLRLKTTAPRPRLIMPTSHAVSRPVRPGVRALVTALYHRNPNLWRRHSSDAMSPLLK